MRQRLSTSNRVCLFLFAVVLVGFILGLNNLSKARAASQERSELYMLEHLKIIIANELDAGSSLPKNWASLATSPDMTLVREICRHNDLPQPEDSYTVLDPKVTNGGGEGGYVVMVRSRPITPAGRNPGRWTLVVDPKPPRITFGAARTTNRVMRVWLPEDSLPQEIRSQLGTKP